MKKSFLLFILCVYFIVAGAQNHWVATWATASQKVESRNNPPAPGLSNNTLRQIVHVSIGGNTLRIKFSNLYSPSPVEIRSVYIANPTDSCEVDKSTVKYLSFVGKRSVTMEANSEVTSDVVDYKLKPLQKLAITISYGASPTVITGHPGSRTTSYIVKGEKKYKKHFKSDARTDHWYNICAVDVMAPAEAACVAILGNSITDGRGSTTNMQNRWTDRLSESLQRHLQTQNVGVLNLGIGGNCVVKGGIATPAALRFNHDILAQAGVKWVMIFEGVNDIGNNDDAKATADNLIAAYKRMILKAHANGLKVYGATITAFKKHSYYTEQHEQARGLVNEWIRKSGWFDAIVDFDRITRDVSDTLCLKASLQDDYLHLNPQGYKLMGESVPVSFFTNTACALPQPEDKDFQVYLAFGQSNMEGASRPEKEDSMVNSRFFMMPTMDYKDGKHIIGEWMPMMPPVASSFGGLNCTSTFGKAILSKYPDNVKVGIVCAAVAGCDIGLFDKYKYTKFVGDSIPKWMMDRVEAYACYPYARLVDVAKKAQKRGIIRGILLHQGETNTGQKDWPMKVRDIYYDLCRDLTLNPDSVPLIVGEVVNKDHQGVCSVMNEVIDTVPDVIPNSYVAKSDGLPCREDHLHFTAAGYRELGERYAAPMLKLLGK